MLIPITLTLPEKVSAVSGGLDKGMEFVACNRPFPHYGTGMMSHERNDFMSHAHPGFEEALPRHAYTHLL